MRFLRRALSIILRLMLLAVILLAILARTQFLHQLVRDQVVALVNSTYRGTLSIGRIQGSVWGSLRLDQVALSHQGKQIVSIPRLSLEYSLVPLLWRQVKLRIFVESPQIKVSRLANGQWNLLDALAEKVPASTKSTERALTIALTSVRVSNGHLQVLPSGAHGPNYRADEVKADMSLTLSSLGVAAKLHSLTATISGPKIPVLYTAVAADYAGVNSPPALRLRDLDLRTQQSTISLSGEVTLAQVPAVNVKLWLHRLAAADIRRLYPSSPLKPDLTGTVMFRGPETSLRTRITLNCGDARLDGIVNADLTQKSYPYAATLKLTDVNLQKIFSASSVAGLLNATVDAEGRGSDVLSSTAKIQLHGRKLSTRQYQLGALDLTGNTVNKNAHLVVKLAAPAGRLIAQANSQISFDPVYQVQFTAQHLDISKAGFNVKGPLTDLNFTTAIDGRGLKEGSLDTRVKLTIAPSRVGQVRVDRGFLLVHIAQDRADIEQLHAEAAKATLDVHGSAGLRANGPATITYRLRSPNIEDLLAVARTKGTGILSLNGTAVGSRSALSTRGTLELRSIRSAGYSLEQGLANYELAVTGSRAPSGKIKAVFTGLQAGPKLRSVVIALEAPAGRVHAATLNVEVIDLAGRRDLVSTHLVYQLPSISGQLTQLVLDLPTGTWHLVHPVNYQREREGFSLGRLKMRSGSRQLLMEGRVALAGEQDFMVELDRFDIGTLGPLAPRLRSVHGTVSARLRITGNAAAPLINFALQAVHLAVSSQPVGDLIATADYRSNEVSFDILIEQSASSRLTAKGSLPVSLHWNNGIRTRIGNTLDVAVNSTRLSLTELGNLFPDQLQHLQGNALVNLRLHGDLRQPEPNGSIELRDVAGKIVPLGITISEAQLIIGLEPSAVQIRVLRAVSGGGSISGNGFFGLAQYAPDRLSINLNFHQWPAINTDQYAARIGGYLSADGTVSNPRLQGQLEVLRGVIQPDISFLSATSDLSPDNTIQVIEPGEDVRTPTNRFPVANSPKLPPPAAPRQTSTFNSLAMKISVLIHRNTWIRHPNAAAELEGSLDVEKEPGGPIRLAGEIRTVRGWIDYYNRQFTLKTGIFSFTGGRKIDPSLDIDAEYRVTNYIVDLMVGGTASKPTLQLKSQPDLPQADILSLILFGKTMDALGQGQQASLQQQATKMATGIAAQQLGQAVASSMGLQQLGITLSQASSGGPALGIGRYLGENTYVSASQSIGGSRGQKISIQYFLLPWLSITTSSAADGSHEIDLNLVKQY